MDETYIRMCDCPEIQEQRPYSGNGGNEFWWCKLHNKAARYSDELQDVTCFVKGWEDCHTFYEWDERDPNLLWLPRQDQLQEMVLADEILDRMGIRFGESKHLFLTERFLPWAVLDTYEKAWLTFVMHELHNKLWDGQEWIKEGSDGEDSQDM